MVAFVDPRSSPEPPPKVSREPATHGEELLEFIRFCSSGRLYGAERWIQEGRPIQALAYSRPKKPAVLSPLRAAIRDHNPDLVLLLVCNGYRLDLEENDQRIRSVSHVAVLRALRPLRQSRGAVGTSGRDLLR